MGYKVATFSTWVTPTVRIDKGELWDEHDPIVRSHPDWFTDDPDGLGLVKRSGPKPAARPPAAAPVESATAAPGERRDVQASRRTRKRDAD